MNQLQAEIASARWRIDHSDMDPVAKLIAHGLINAHIALFRELGKGLSRS